MNESACAFAEINNAEVIAEKLSKESVSRQESLEDIAVSYQDAKRFSVICGLHWKAGSLINIVIRGGDDKTCYSRRV